MDRVEFNPHNKRQVLVTGALVLMTTGITGCAELVISDADLKRISAAVETVVTSSVCDQVPVPPAGNKTIDIEFEHKGSDVWCPTGQVEACPQVFQSAKVQWRSVRKNESGEWVELNTRFRVYFTPFRGDAFTAANGKTGLKNFDPDAPPGIYKYTVWDWPTGTNPHKCEPLDPTFRVN